MKTKRIRIDSNNISASTDLVGIITDKDLVVVVVPSHVMRNVIKEMAGHLSDNVILISASKGIEQKTHLTMSGVIKENLPENTEQGIMNVEVRKRLKYYLLLHSMFIFDIQI